MSLSPFLGRRGVRWWERLALAVERVFFNRRCPLLPAVMGGLPLCARHRVVGNASPECIRKRVSHLRDPFTHSLLWSFLEQDDDASVRRASGNWQRRVSF